MSFKITVTAESAEDAQAKILALAVQFGLEVGPRLTISNVAASKPNATAGSAATTSAPRGRGRPPSKPKVEASAPQTSTGQISQTPTGQISQTSTAPAPAPSTDSVAPEVAVSSPRVSSDEGFKPTKAELVDVLKQVMVKIQPEDVKKMMIAAVGVGKISEVPEDKYLALYQACEAKLAEIAAA